MRMKVLRTFVTYFIEMYDKTDYDAVMCKAQAINQETSFISVLNFNVYNPTKKQELTRNSYETNPKNIKWI